MSISSMTNIALMKRSGADLATYRLLEDGAAGARVAQTDVTAALKAIASYVPTEVLTVYVAVIATLQAGNGMGTTGVLAFWIFLAMTPIVVWLVFAAKLRAGGQPLPWPVHTWPLWEMSAAAVAFAAWALALPDNPFKASAWYSPGVAGVGVLIASMTLGLIAPLAKKP